MVNEPLYFIEPGMFTKKKVFPIKGWKSLYLYSIGIMRGMEIVEEGTKGMKTMPVIRVQ